MLQSLLNIFVPIPNYLFSIIRNKDSKINHYSLVKNFISFIITGILITPLFLISLIFEILAVILKKGGVVRIVYKKI